MWKGIQVVVILLVLYFVIEGSIQYFEKEMSSPLIILIIIYKMARKKKKHGIFLCIPVFFPKNLWIYSVKICVFSPESQILLSTTWSPKWPHAVFFPSYFWITMWIQHRNVCALYFCCNGNWFFLTYRNWVNFPNTLSWSCWRLKRTIIWLI